ncbi:MAG: tetratricopeptide repeat protein [Proteobacteria bacterium]|nr:tetratricopeptide repeat protein [Pseudomonadota bacterium]
MPNSHPAELAPEVQTAVTALCAEGDALASAGRYEDAVQCYNSAFELVPEPKSDWNASTWILAAIGDACFLGDYRTSAREALEYAMSCPDAVGNPFLHLRLGQVLFDAGEEEAAADNLMRAYMGAGAEIFADQHPKYRQFLATRAIL